MRGLTVGAVIVNAIRISGLYGLSDTISIEDEGLRR